MAEYAEVRPGLFHLIKTEEASPEGVDKSLEGVKECLDEFGGYPATGINNATGLLQFLKGSVDDKEDAIDSFRKALAEDPSNLNALENSHHVFADLGRDEEAQECASKIEDLGKESQSSSRDVNLRRARCLVEQAFAMEYIHLDEQRGEAYVTANEYFDRAFQLDSKGSGLFCPEERRQWKHFHAMALHHIYGHYMKMHKELDVRIEVFDKAVNILAEIIENSNTDVYKAKAWCLLGTFFWKEAGWEGGIADRGIPKSVVDRKLSVEYRFPDNCFQEAIKLSPNDPKILSRYSRYLVKSEQFEKAVFVLSKSINLDKSAANWFAFSTRAFAYKKMYLAQQNANRGGGRGRGRGRGQRSGPPLDRSLLEKAKEDLQYSIKICGSVIDVTEIGQIYQMLGDLDQARAQFEYVINRLNGEMNMHIHLKMGYCLRDLDNNRGEDHARPAAESFKRVIEIESSKHSPQSLFQLLLLLFKMCENRTDIHRALLEEIRFWLAEGFAKYDDPSFPIDRVCQHNPGKMIAVCKSMISKQQRDVAKECLFYLGHNPNLKEDVEQMLNEMDDPATSMSALSLVERPMSSILPALRTACNKRGKKYDWVVLHHDQGRDADWVCYSLLPRLEDCHGYKGCVPVRDLQSQDDISSVVGDAACVIVILTPTFTADEGCLDLLNIIVAGDETLVLLPVMLGECPVPESLGRLKVIQYCSWELLIQGIESACRAVSGAANEQEK